MHLHYHRQPAHHLHLLHFRIGMRLPPEFLKVTRMTPTLLVRPLHPFRPFPNRLDGSKNFKKQLLTLIVQNFLLK